LVVGDASADGLRLAGRYGVETVAFRTGPVHPLRNLQWDRCEEFALWLAPRLAAADLVHAHMIGAWWAAAQVIEAHTPLVATEHNEVGWSVRRTATLHPAAARVDHFYAMGPAARQFALDAGVRPEVLRQARSPVAGLSAAPRTGLPRPRLTFAGRFCRDKGPDVLVEAIALLRRPELTSYLLGAGPMRDQLMDMVKRHGLEAQVVMPGWVDKPWTYVAGSSVHVVPSREEAWSQSAVLGLGLGVPVVGTRVDGLTDTLSQSRGVVVAPDDPAALSQAIAAVLDGAVQPDRGGAIGYARTFAPARIADFYYAEYESVLRQPAGLSSRGSVQSSSWKQQDPVAPFRVFTTAFWASAGPPRRNMPE
jgi:glycosyltransferase involved in cell wall biosynthesis